ncbi:hypothetical protein OIU93_03865 [Paeniglutamicibacter sp. ZC-3]|uniref:hypothetical protein n=1 Tax=Paeniglutamicibacter sp. ZC-3 TaxID=2986919 RepID=UPI0021F7547A|nr:hypothetical protein [Paeniglutamicibacter sp. ZC-3]MCV9993432.1 hypothetical protein [Paeniglutamicibacter sp. ZC-3]
MALGYRSIIRLGSSENAVEIAEAQMREWLKSKQTTARGELTSYDWSGPGVHSLGLQATLTVVTHSGEDGTNRQLLRFIEKNTAGIWRVAVTAHSSPHSKNAQQVIVVEVDNDSVNDKRPASERTDPPRIIKQIIDSVDAMDYHSDLHLRSRPQVVHDDEVESLMHALEDAQRNTSIVVAGALPGAPMDAWAALIEKLLSKSAGTASAFVLTAPANEALNKLLGPAHAVASGSVRTFLPGAVPNDLEDSQRHRILTARSFASSIDKGQRVRRSLLTAHATSSRRRLLDQPLPSEVLRTMRVLERTEIETAFPNQNEASLSESAPISENIGESRSDQRPVASDVLVPHLPNAAPRESAPAPNTWVKKLAELFKTTLGTEVVSEGTVGQFTKYFHLLRQRFDSSNRGLSDLLEKLHREQDTVSTLQKQLDVLELDLAIAEGQRRKASRLSEYRGEQLKELKEFGRLVDPEGSGLDEPPSSISDLLDRLESEITLSKYIVFTGDLEKALTLEAYDVVGRYAEAFWEYLLVLRDYCIARESGSFSGGIYMYLTDDSAAGRKCDPKRFASTESTSVQQNSAWSAERAFPVPATADPSRKRLMYAHFKPTHSDTFAPRMHIYDDFHKNGKIYIGYLGRHLTNTKTN